MHKTQIGLGLAAIGRPDYINIREEKDIDKSLETFEKNAHFMFDFAYKMGIRHFDTAASYGKGEQFLIDWNNLTKHSDVILSSKWGYTYVANWQIGFKGEHEIKEHSIEKLLEQWQQAKQLLPALSTYQIHSATFESGVLENKEVLSELLRIKRENEIKIGISTSGVNQKEVIERALEVELNGEILFDSFQVTFNVLEQSCFEILRNAMTKKKQIIIKESLANGRVFNSNYSILSELSQKYQVGIDAICLRFVMDYLQPDLVLSGAFNTKQLSENLLAKEIQLEKSDIESLKKLAMKSADYWAERKALEWN